MDIALKKHFLLHVTQLKMELYRIISEEDYQKLIDQKPISKKATFELLNKIQKRRAIEIVRLLKRSGISPDEKGEIKSESLTFRLEPYVTFTVTGGERPDHFETFLALLTSSKIPVPLIHKSIRAEYKEIKKNAKKRSSQSSHN